MIIQRTMSAEPILQDIGPGAPGLIIATQRSQRHPEVTRRQAAEFVTEPSGGAAVVSHGHDRS
jgi:hypothetical protein